MKVAHLHTPEMKARTVEAIRNSPLCKGQYLHTPEIRARAIKAFKNSPLCKGDNLRTPEIKARRIESIRNSSICEEQRKKWREANKNSEKCKAGLKHHQCKKWHIRSPSNVEYHFINLAEFIRTHQDLFDPIDIPKNSYHGIALLRPSNKRKVIPGSWKGWTWISLCEAFYNSSNDLLDRNVETK